MRASAHPYCSKNYSYFERKIPRTDEDPEVLKIAILN